MTNPSPSQPGVCTANVQLTVGGRQIGVRVSVPDRNVRPEELLPFYRSMAELMINVAVGEAKQQGLNVTCRAGCGACCRQLVPISAVEGRQIVKLIENLPEPRRSQVKDRFAHARRKLEEAGLLPRLLHPQDFPDEVMREINYEYWAHRIPCPFLENESCSIYDERPISCREFLVVSDPKHCSEPRAENVQALKTPAGPMGPRLPIHERSPGGKPVNWVPLILAPDFVAEHPQEPTPKHATQLVGEFFETVARDK